MSRRFFVVCRDCSKKYGNINPTNSYLFNWTMDTCDFCNGYLSCAEAERFFTPAMIHNLTPNEIKANHPTLPEEESKVIVPFRRREDLTLPAIRREQTLEKVFGESSECAKRKLEAPAEDGDGWIADAAKIVREAETNVFGDSQYCC